jgi:hypothetical protein
LGTLYEALRFVLVLLLTGALYLEGRRRVLTEAELNACITYASAFQVEQARKHRIPIENVRADAREFNKKNNGVISTFVKQLEIAE